MSKKDVALNFLIENIYVIHFALFSHPQPCINKGWAPIAYVADWLI